MATQGCIRGGKVNSIRIKQHLKTLNPEVGFRVATKPRGLAAAERLKKQNCMRRDFHKVTWDIPQKKILLLWTTIPRHSF